MTSKQRLPAPALFVGPPSHNASTTSLLSPSTDKPLVRQHSLLAPDSKRPLPPTTDVQDGDSMVSSRADAMWAEMQNTLEEVELSAIRGPGMTVFGAEHARALDELRRAQIELAQAWARSDDGGAGEVQRKASAVGSLAAGRPRSGSSPGGDRMFDRMRLEEETERDIELSRKRREENDGYFERVNRGVQEVVVRLEEVAKAMRGVESESNEIWGTSAM